MNSSRYVLFTILVLLSPVRALWAHPPAAIKLEYDQKQKSLHIEVAHVSHDPRDHHIRKISVTRNDGKPVIRYFPTQTKPSSLIVEVPLEAKKNDTIKVLAVCNEGGQKEETLVVP